MSRPRGSSSVVTRTPRGRLMTQKTAQLAVNTAVNAAGTPNRADAAVAGGDRGRERGGDADRVAAERRERAGVEQAAVSDAVVLGQVGRREQPAREGAPDARHAVRGQGADGVVQHPV